MKNARDREDMDAAAKILPLGYAHASGNGRFKVDKRQMYYACREGLRNLTDRQISADNFSQVLDKYMSTHPVRTANWKIVAARPRHRRRPNNDQGS
jgi:hypothetical protein